MALLDDSTVLLTGASAGIGRALARLLAPRVRTLLLVARRLDRLEALRDELLADNPRLAVRCFRCDLADAAAVEALCRQVSDDATLPPVDVLINNAGVGEFGLYDRADWARVASMIELNVTTPARLTHHFVPDMVARGRGGVLNISSGFGVAFLPGFAAYVGSKHFVSGFTETLGLDLAGTGVHVTHVCPGPVATEFAAQVGVPEGFASGDALIPRWAMISDVTCARAALRGLEAGRTMVVPGLMMKLAYLLSRVSPLFLTRLVLRPLGALLRKRELAAASTVPRSTNEERG